MKLPGLIDVGLILIVASFSNGQQWDINVTQHINATFGSNLTIPCSFSYPPKHHTADIQVFWKKQLRSNFDTKDNDKNAFVFHTNDTFVLDTYRGKTRLIGNKDKGNCTLLIQDIKENEPNIYVRVIAKGEQFSFIKKFVQISLPGVEQATLQPDVAYTLLPTFETMSNTQKTSVMYMAIFLSLAALLVIILIAGVVCCIKHKRSKPCTKEEPAHYANFTGAPSNKAKREASFEKQDKKRFPEPKATDDPVYINMEAPRDQMDRRMDHMDSIYANVDYLK